ncbi:MAG TPA: DNRLRE domain-containing protein [Thermoanaerobaculia bacterium]|nr:DNRLRE domain-containing protein [Thermoanaerobaculia bacterium]
MMRRLRFRPLMWLCLASSLALPLAAQPAADRPARPQRPQEIRRALQPVYEALKKDPEYQRFQRELAARPKDAALQESYLRFLPLSPIEIFKIDREARRFESAVPRFIHEAHARWVRLHETEARRLYGHAKVDSLLAEWPADPPARAAGAGGGLDSLSQAFSLGTNRNVAEADDPVQYQGEIQLSVNPNDPDQMVAAANTWSGPASCPGSPVAVFSSADGGGSWSYVCAPEAAAYAGLGLDTCFGEFVYGSDPALSWDDQGRVYLNHMLICASFRTGIMGMAIVVARSVDGGATWAPHGVVIDSFFDGYFEDKNFYAIDTTPTSPFYGRHYACWDRFNDQRVAYSSNGGAAWTEVDLPPAPFGGTDIFCEMAVADDGTVHMAFDSLTCAAGCTNEAMFYTRSTDGGLTWSAPVLVRDFELASFSNGANCPIAQDDRCINPFGSIAIDNTGGACDGHLYTTFSDFAPDGNVNSTDVWVSRSTNNGVTWSAPVKVNDDGLPNRSQFHPFLQVDQSNGSVVVAWQDARNHAGNDGLDFFTARSTDCGVSFGPNVQASQPSAEFNNSGVSSSNHNSFANPNYNPNQTGEYMGLDAIGGKAYLAWTDTRHYFPGSAAEAQKDNLGFAVVDWTGGTPTVCGNGVREGGEQCDGADLGGATCLSRGFASGTLACKSNCAFDTAGCVTAPPVTVTFASLAAEDGYVLESDETTSVGGTATGNDATASGIRAGDDRRDKQLRGLVSFDTAAIPDGAVIQSATLRLRRGAVTGTNPFTTHGSLAASIRTGGFNGNVALETADFQAAATASAVCTLSSPAANGDWAECTLNPAGLAALNKTGKTQLRIAFTSDDNDDRGDDYIGFYAGNNATAANHPQLVVVYQ